ncbi:hypothetical protein BH20ACT17_BH20ACT17_04870 [soil metagenome]
MPIAGRASADIEAPIDAVWPVLQDVEQWAAWQGTLGHVDVLERDAEDRVSRCEVQIDAKIQKIRLELAITYDPPLGVSWERDGGDLKHMEGSWQLEDLGDRRTRATYALEVEPGGILNLLINASVEEKLRGTLVDARPAELKARVESG